MKKITVLVLLVILISFFAIGCSKEVAKAYPEKNISFVVVRGAGGGSDVIARLLAAKLEPVLDTSVTVINKTGGDGVIGMNEIYKAEPDGYTLAAIAAQEVPFSIVNGTGVEYTKDDFKYLGCYASLGHILATKKGLGISNVEEMIAYAKANPGKLTVGIPGGGNSWAVNDMMRAMDIEVTIVNCGTGSELLAQLLGGHVDMGLPGAQFAERLLDGGCGVIAQTVESEEFGLPGVPCFTEMGYDVVQEVRFLLAGSANLPDDVVKTLSDAMETLYNDPEFAKEIEKTNNVPLTLNSAESHAYMEDYTESMIPKLTSYKN